MLSPPLDLDDGFGLNDDLGFGGARGGAYEPQHEADWWYGSGLGGGSDGGGGGAGGGRGVFGSDDSNEDSYSYSYSCERESSDDCGPAYSDGGL